jgi:hypothetical protein
LPLSSLRRIVFPLQHIATRGGCLLSMLGASAVGCVSVDERVPWVGDDHRWMEPPTDLRPVELDCPTPLVRFADADGDGHGSAAVRVEVCEETPGFVSDDSDCDDLRADISPSAPEVCGDAIDHDCNGLTEACPEPDLDQDAVAVVQGEERAFPRVIVGDLDLNGADDPWAALGAMDAVGDDALDVDAGLLWQIGDPDLLVAGTEVEVLDVESGRMTGPRHSGLGRALAGADPDGTGERTRLYAATAGPISTALGTAPCGVFWFDGAVPSGGDLVESADGFLPCHLKGDPDLVTPGIDTLAVGFWNDDGGVVAAHHPDDQIVWVLPSPERNAGLDMREYGIELQDSNKEALGAGLAWGDLDGDSIVDLVATTPERSSVVDLGGGLDVYPGDLLQDLVRPSAVRAPTLGLGVAGTIEASHLGASVAVVDLDGDGLDEVVLGGQSEDPSWAARVLVLQLGALEEFGGDRVSLDALPDSASYTWILSDTPGDSLGHALATVGDGGLAIGAPTHQGADGRVYTLAASPDFFDSVERSVESAAAAVIDTNRPGEGLGSALSAAGDVDADGRVDLWILSEGIANDAPRALLLFDTRL